MTGEDNENAEDLFPMDMVPQAEARTSRALKPWHKPRKQWVRLSQWGHVIDDLARRLKLSDRPFKYLTLPGEDLFDVRVLHEVCCEHGIQLKFLGFDSARNTERNIAFDEVLRLSHVHKSSQLFPDRIELICQARSLAAQNLQEYSGFDAINLDFCDSIGGREAGSPDTHLEAITAILKSQTDHRAEPWVLFVTTRCNQNSVKESVRQVLTGLIVDNASTHDEFRRRIESEPFRLSLAGSSQYKEIDEAGHLYTIGVGFSKWMIRLAMNAWAIRQEVSAGYRTVLSSPVPDMLSLAFVFERVQPHIVDSTGLVVPRKVERPPNKPDELMMAHAALDQFKALVDVDRLFHDDAELRESMILSNAELMATARYDLQEVLDWSRENCWQPVN